MSHRSLADGGPVYSREDPGAKMRKESFAGGDVAKSTIGGIATGLSTAGPIGAIVGGATSFFTSLIKANKEAEATNELADQASQDWARFWGSRSVQATQESGYAEGGKIKGPGTGKSDSVGMTAPEGAFIVPKENSAQAMAYGADYLGWDDNEVASRNYGNTDINVSNGEVFYTPDEYNTLNYYGVDVDGLAPNAEQNKTGFCRGGKVKGYADGGTTIADLEKKNQEVLERDISSPLNKYVANSMDAIQKELSSTEFADVAKVPVPEGEGDGKKFPWGEVAGAAQALGGTAGLIAAGRRPDVNVSKTLERLSRETREAAGYGLPPAVKNEMKKEQDKAFRQSTNVITGGGGSAQEKHNRTISALSQLLSARGKTELMDYQAKEAKIDRNIGIEKLIGQQEFDIDKIGLGMWKEDQDTWANLLSTGIENFIGARQYANESEIMKALTKDRNTTNITFPKA